MQISLRSQMLAGTTALVGATAIAMTPMAPAVQLPSLSTANTSVALAAFSNPISALLGTVGLVGNYTLNGANTSPAVNWPNSGIGAIINAAVISQGVVTPGLLPNIIQTPLPIATVVATNLLGYGWIAAQTAGGVAADIGDILWSIPATAVTVGLDLLSLNVSQAIADIQAAVQAAVTSATNAIGTAIAGVSTIVNSIIYKATNAVNFIVSEIPTLTTILSAQVALVAGAVTGAVQDIVGALSGPNPIEGVWNAAVDGLLSPTGLPGTVINLTQGAGIQVTADPTTFVPSVRTTLTGAINGVAEALNAPLPAAAAVRSAAAKAAPAAAVAASTTEAASSDAAAAPAKKVAAKVGRHAASAKAAAAK